MPLRDNMRDTLCNACAKFGAIPTKTGDFRPKIVSNRQQSQPIWLALTSMQTAPHSVQINSRYSQQLCATSMPMRVQMISLFGQCAEEMCACK